MYKKLFLISGPSGSGKSTIMRHIMGYNSIVSFTTRQPRKGEFEAIDYNFISVDQFEELYRNQGLVEYTKYRDNFYGVQTSELDKLDHSDLYFICDIIGMQTMKSEYSNTTSIYIYTDMDSAIKNLKNRGDSDEAIESRVSNWQKELLSRQYYDYVIRNNYGKLKHTIRAVSSIIKSELEMSQ